MASVTFKIVICGDYAVGKTTLVKMFLDGNILSGYKPTIGVDIGRKVIKIDSQDITFQIWDLSGQESFKAIRKQFYARVDGGVLVFDVSRRESYQNIIHWAEEMLEQTGNIPIILVGNKIDLREKIDDSIKTDEGILLSRIISKKTGLETPFIEASALQRQNNLEPFIELGKLILTMHMP